jgi:hypothetical protein
MPTPRSVPLQALLLLAFTSPLFPQAPAAPGQPLPSADQIVARMQQHEAHQSEELKHYEAVRHYQVQYKGLVTLSGEMAVAITYDEVSGKSFRILSQSGSKLLCDKVLRRAVESEQEASRDRQSTALTPANYRFRLIGTEQLNGRPSYILHVEPLRDGKFLYRGHVWVDAAQYAVEKIEVEPAKNPSFWITSTQIESTNADTDGIWLPQKNRSESKIRVGGTAVLTIDYGAYQIALTRQPQQPTTSAEAASSQ